MTGAVGCVHGPAGAVVEIVAARWAAAVERQVDTVQLTGEEASPALGRVRAGALEPAVPSPLCRRVARLGELVVGRAQGQLPS